MKLSDWARKQGISYKTAWRLYKSGQFPLTTEQLPTGTIIVHDSSPMKEQRTVLYARVSSYDQKEDLTRQLQRLRDYVAKHGLQVSKEVTEIGSGLNTRRAKLLKVLKDHSYTQLVVEHRDRLVRCGFEYVEAALQSTGRNILILNQEECTDDLVQDMIDVLTSFCGRLYGRRSARRRAKKALEVMQE